MRDNNFMNFRKAQVSIEFAVIIGLVITMLIPALVFVMYSSYENTASYANAQANLVASRIASEVNMVGTSGEGASIYFDVNIPPYVNFLNITGREVVIQLETDAGPSDTFRITKFNLTGNNLDRIRPGLIKFRLDAINKTNVNVTVI